jgi:NodT family efflux transporter outer membrane factor (OMF) lipoprotein
MHKPNWLNEERNGRAMEGSSHRLAAPQAAFPAPYRLASTPSLSNRYTGKIELPVSYRKQTTAVRSNRDKFDPSLEGLSSPEGAYSQQATNKCRPTENSSTSSFLTETVRRLEVHVSHGKRTTYEFLIDTRTHFPSFPFSLFPFPFSKPNRHIWTAFCALTFGLSVLFVGGCTVGPNYVRPPVDAPPAYKEASNFKPAAPSDQTAKGKWWEIYQDPQLNALEEQVSVSNLNIKSAQAQFLAARAAVRISRSALFPNVTGSLSVSRTDQSQTKALFSPGEQKDYNDFQIPVDVSYEPDVWGRVRRTVEASRSEAQATAADLASIELSFHAELAMDYFELRGLDAQQQLFDSTVESYEEALKLTKNRYDGGLASAVDYAQAQTQLETTRAQAQDVGVQRTAMEHAIAVLIGKPASIFSLAASPLTIPPPPFPAGLPSDLLERRPDVAAAERRVQEANAQIGVARAAYFPLVQLGGSGGFESAAIGTLLQGPSGFWQLAGTAAETLFDGGQRRGATEQAKALFDKSVDDYRLTVITSFQEVEDNLAALRILEQEAKTQDAAVAAAEHSLSLSNTRYRGGVANYLEVTTAQSAALLDERAAVDILTRRMAASVLLIKAIGGGWNVSQIPPV